MIKSIGGGQNLDERHHMRRCGRRKRCYCIEQGKSEKTGRHMT